MGGPFGALRVIDLSSGQAGGVATMVLPGEHTDRLLEELGHSAFEVARLRSEGGRVVGRADGAARAGRGRLTRLGGRMVRCRHGR